MFWNPPLPLQGVVVARDLPVLSHLALRARQLGVVFACTAEAKLYESLKGQAVGVMRWIHFGVVGFTPNVFSMVLITGHYLEHLGACGLAFFLFWNSEVPQLPTFQKFPNQPNPINHSTNQPNPTNLTHQQTTQPTQPTSR